MSPLSDYLAFFTEPPGPFIPLPPTTVPTGPVEPRIEGVARDHAITGTESGAVSDARPRAIGG
jgi:hypothetical protein